MAKHKATKPSTRPPPSGIPMSDLSLIASESLVNFRQLAEHIHQVLYVTDLRKNAVLYVNPAYERVWGRSCESLYQTHSSFLEAIHPEDQQRVKDMLGRQKQGQETQMEYRILQPDGSLRWISDRSYPVNDAEGQVYRAVGLADDITHQKATETRLLEQSELLERVMSVGQLLVAELDLHKIVQAVTDAARELCEAQFGAFFYNVLDEKGARYTLYTSSGAPREAFANYPMPGATDSFGPTFRGEGTVRIDDVSQGVRYGKNDPHFGMPPGHLPVVSYLAVSVISRSGEILGGLFFGHEEAGVFTESKARLVEHLATQAAVAMDNARLFEMVQQERALARSNEQDYQFLAESIPQMVWVANAEGAITYLNHQWTEYTGQEPEMGNDWGWQPVLHPDDLDRCLERWKHSLSTGEIYEIEYRLRRNSDGVYRWHLGRGLPLRGEDGKISRWFGTCTDIDDQKRSQEAVQFLADAGIILGSSLDYRKVVESLTRLAVPRLCDWCVVDIEENGKLTRWAAAHQDPEKVQLAFDFFERYPPRKDAEIGAPYVLRTGKSQLIREVTDEMLVESAHDDEMLSLLRRLGFKSAMCVPINVRGQTLGVMTLISAENARLYSTEDLLVAEELARRAGEASHNAQLYRETQEALQQTKEAMRARDEFLAIVSHELKTPLTPVLGWVTMLQSQLSERAPDDHIHRALEVIERNVRSQSQLIDDLLDVSRIITGKLRLVVRPITLVPVIEAAIETVNPAANAKSIEIRTNLNANAAHIKGDPARLQQVMWNLLANSIKFTPKGGLVEVQLMQVDSTVLISVRDTGEGIPQQFLPHIFDRFQQVDSTPTRQHGGLGLGLSIVRHIVEMHGGTVSVESPGMGLGTTFRVKLPVLAVAMESQPSSNDAENQLENEFIQSANVQTSRDLLNGLRILVVEDEDDAREMVTMVLINYGAQVQAVNSASRGLELVQEWQPDVLVSDIGMPHEDGYSLLRKVRALPAGTGGKTPALALTAYARMEDRLKALAAGFQNHLAKPVDPAELAITIASIVGRTASPD